MHIQLKHVQVKRKYINQYKQTVDPTERCQQCRGSGKVHSHNDRCWECHGTGHKTVNRTTINGQ